MPRRTRRTRAVHSHESTPTGQPGRSFGSFGPPSPHQPHEEGEQHHEHSHLRTAAAVRGPNPNEQQAQFGLLLAIRRRARQALDTLLALPRGAAGWVLRQLRTLLDGVGQHHLLDKAAALLRNGIRFVRGVGVIPLVASVLSTPPVWRTAVRWARAAGTALAGFGRGLWARAKGLLTRSGTTGARIAQALSRAGTTVVTAAQAVASHPVIQQVMQAVRSSGRTGPPTQPDRGRAPSPRPARPGTVDPRRPGGPGHAAGHRCRHARRGPPRRKQRAGARRSPRTAGRPCPPRKGQALLRPTRTSPGHGLRSEETRPSH